jgi:hypothetical protein
MEEDLVVGSELVEIAEDLAVGCVVAVEDDVAGLAGAGGLVVSAGGVGVGYAPHGEGRSIDDGWGFGYGDDGRVEV